MKVRKDFNDELIIEFALKEGLAACRESAKSAMDAVLQLLACHAESEQMEIAFVFANGEVYGMYSALRNCFGQNFDAFCYDQFGVLHHHLLLSDVSFTHMDVDGGTIYTLGQLEGHFEKKLSPMLHDWVKRREENHLRACALIWSKSWAGEMFSVSPHSLTRLASRWTQFVD